MSNSVTAVQAAGAVAPALKKPGAVAPAPKKPGTVAPKPKAKPARPTKTKSSRISPSQCKAFLAALSANPNIAAASRKAKVHSTRVYAERLASAAFQAEWDRALATGYVRLEAFALERALEIAAGKIKPDEMAKTEKELKLINAQLSHHRAAVRGEGTKPKMIAQNDVCAANLRVEQQLRLQRRRTQALHGKG